MASVLDRLVRPSDRLVLLLTPPFHDIEPDPGYIRSYPPGVRENGGQYTHAATWVGLALARLGAGDEAMEIFRLLSPARHSVDEESARLYRVEPYVVPGDVYGAQPWIGRGGWTWYTGSAAWLYRLGMEGILGIQPVPGGIRIRPCIPADWRSYEVSLGVGGATEYRVLVRNPHGARSGVASIRLDGSPVDGDTVQLDEDGVTHRVEVTLGEPSSFDLPAYSGSVRNPSSR